MRPFGYREDRTTVIPEEAEVLALAAERVLSGGTLRATTAWLNLQGHRTSTGGKWSPITLRRLLASPRSAGVVMLEDGRYDEAPWPALLDREVWEKLRLLLTDESRRATQQTRREYLLTGGLAVCGLCGTTLIPRAGRYVCRSGPPDEGCGRITIVREFLDDYAATRVLARLADPRYRQQLLDLGSDAAAAAAEEVQRLQARLTEASADYAVGDLSRTAYQEASRSIQTRMQEARRRGQRADEAYIIAPLTSSWALADWWEAATLNERRRVVKLALRQVIVNSATVLGSKVFQSSRVRLDWFDAQERHAQ